MTKDRPSAAKPSDEFNTLLGKLVAAPKSEVEAEEKKWKAMRKRLKAKGEAGGAKRRKLPPKADE